MPKRPSWYYDPPPPSEAAPSRLEGELTAPDAAAQSAQQKMSDAQRVVGESRMLRTDASEITEEQIAEVIAATKAYLKEHGVSQAQLAKGLCLGSSSVSQVLGGKYNADARPIIIAMDRWLERRTEADKQPEVNTFVETEVATKIRLAAKMAIRAADSGIDNRLALVFGDPGCGKTIALRAVAETEDAIFIECGVEVCSARAVMEKIAEALGMRSLPYNTAQAFAVIVEKLRGSGKLIVVDEIHALLDARNDNAFHFLRRLSDQTGCPQLWAATCDLVSILKERQHKREPLGQITRRFCAQIHLTAKLHAGAGGGGRPEPLFTVDQVIAMFARNEMKLTRDAGRFLANLCRDAELGLLGECTMLVLHATVMNRAKGGQITPQMLWEAATFIHQFSVLTQIKRSVETDLKEMKIKFA